MKSCRLQLALSLGVLVLAAACHSSAPMEHGSAVHVAITPDAVQWQDGPPSLPPGARMAVLEGNPAAAGFFVLRLRLPAGYRIPPHWHPKPERLTVISGAFSLGEGEVFEAAQAKPYRAGSYLSMPPGMRHFAVAYVPTEIQLATTGPWEINYVNPADDPRAGGGRGASPGGS